MAHAGAGARSPVVGREAVFARVGRYAADTGGTFRADLKRVLTDEDGRAPFYDLHAWDEFWS